MNIELSVNTPDEVLFSNIRENSSRSLPWIKSLDAHSGQAVIVGGGPSVPDWLEEIRYRQGEGQDVFALNNAFGLLLEHGIHAEYQVILDARELNLAFLGIAPKKGYLLSAQCHPSLFAKAGDNAKLWHPLYPEQLAQYEPCVPEDRRGEVDMVGGGSTVGLSAMSLAYMMGYRKLHLYGYDSSYRSGATHAYKQHDPQRINCEVTVRGRKFQTSLAMAGQAERFTKHSDNLIDLGCLITLRGEGLLPFLSSEAGKPLSEQQKYELMWQRPEYRKYSPGEQVAGMFLEMVKPQGMVLDIGCGTGRGGLAISRVCPVTLIDIADNCRDEAARRLPFISADISVEIPIQAQYGFCTDVMEHIPTEQVEAVLRNIATACKTAFFQICTLPDSMGALIGEQLHLTVKPAAWWKDELQKHWKQVAVYDGSGELVAVVQ